MNENRKNPISFFFSDFHSGAANVIFHCAGFVMLGFGLGINNITMITLATGVMELGHFYNALRGRHREYSLLAIPAQWVLWLIFIWIGATVYRLIVKI